MENGRRPSGGEMSRGKFIVGAGLSVAALAYGRQYPNVRAAEDILWQGLGSIAVDLVTGKLSSTPTQPNPTEAPRKGVLPPTVEASADKMTIKVIKYPGKDRIPPVAKENYQAKYITMHYTVGADEPNSADLKAYHFVFGRNGNTHECRATVQHQAPPPGQKDIDEKQMYAPHTSYANTRNIGLSMCGSIDPVPQRGINEFSPQSLDSMLRMAAFQAQINKIPIDKDHIKTHYQWAQYFAQKKVDTENAGKTDITQIPWMPELNTPEKVHEYMLKKIAEYAKRSIRVDIV